MSWFTLPENPTPEENRAINTRFLVCFITLAVVIVLIVLTLSPEPAGATGTTIISDDFESYTIGVLGGQDNWYNTGATHGAYVSATQSYSSPQSAYFSGSVYRYAKNEENTQYPEGQIDYWFYAENTPVKFTFDIYRYGYSSFFQVSVSSTASVLDVYIKDPATTTPVLIGSGAVLNNWNKVSIQWATITDALTNNYRASYNNSSWSSWYSKTHTLATEINLDSIQIYGYAGGSFYIDDVGIISCGIGNCGSCSGPLLCQSAGCCWDYLPGGLWLPGGNNWCGECGAGECGGDSIYDCQYCLNSLDCEGSGMCYWATSTASCLTGHPECGPGTSLFLCGNETDCINNEGYWYEGSCWTIPEPTDLIDWATYYASYGDYSTSSAWIADVASTTTSLFKKVNSFMGLFDNNFDLGTAQAKGKTFGGTIPLARGYLQIIDAFLGNMPIGELLVFVLLFMMCVGIFRLVKGLVQLLHIW
jgi:hypothetical protein